jgi:hypothetical protein
MAAPERFHGICGSAYDGLLMNIEAGIDDSGQSGTLSIFFDNSIKAWIIFFMNKLRPCRAIHMDDRRTALSHPIGAVERDRHESRGV